MKQTTSPLAAIDFGISNTDAIALINGEWRRWTQPYDGDPTPDDVVRILAKGGIDLTQLAQLAVTGGRHKLLPPNIGVCQLVSVGELDAIGRGGRALADLSTNPQRAPVLVVSAGSGTAIVASRYNRIYHVSGTAVGGGTMLGLSRLLLNTINPLEIETLASQGSANGVDLSLADVITGPIGALPADATAVNFGRLARHALQPSRADMAAGIVNLVAQVIGLLAINAARAQRIETIVVIGHLIDMPSIRRVLELVSHYYHTPIRLPEHAGFGTALGALQSLSR
jgi:type II pantothenate kinase